VQTPHASTAIVAAAAADVDGGAGCVTVALPDPPSPRPVRLAPRPAVLVTVAADGFVEVFASPGVRVHLAERLSVEPGDEIFAEAYLEAGLPLWAREIFQPMDLVATLAPRPATPAEELDRQTELAAFAALRHLGATWKEPDVP